MTGMVADVGEWHSRSQYRRAPRPTPKVVILFAVVTALCVCIPAVYIAAQMPEPIALQEDTPVPEDNSTAPGQHVIVLNVTARADTPTSTFYLFEDCPDFLALRAQYGAFSGMLIRNCSGDPGVITVRENNGKMIDSFYWEGHPLISMNSWHSWYYAPTGALTSETWGWWENATMDWVAGTWCPADGILVEHQANQTMGNASMDVVYFVPEPIPEFSVGFVVIVSMVVIALIAGRRRR